MPRYGDLDALQSRLQRNADLYKGCNDADMKARRDEALNAVACVVNAPTADVAPVVHARWKYYHKQNIAVCTNCSFERDLDANFGKAVSCPNCGAKMDGKGNG